MSSNPSEEAIPALLHMWSLAPRKKLGLKTGQQNWWVKHKTKKESPLFLCFPYSKGFDILILFFSSPEQCWFWILSNLVLRV